LSTHQYLQKDANMRNHRPTHAFKWCPTCKQTTKPRTQNYSSKVCR